MRNRAGMNTSVVFGFVKFLRDIQKRERPDLLGVAFDPKGGSFRRDIFPEYKANRSETPEDILLSVPYVKRVLEAMCIPILEVEGYEADDVIGTLSQKGVEAGYDVYMVTPDKDYGQLVRDHCRIYKQRGAEGSIEIVGREAIREKYGIDDPQLVRDILALWGDASDNIPGVPGIGEKSACKLVQEWGTVENILDNVSKIQGKTGREDRRVGRQPASGQAPDDHLPRRADPLPRGGPHGLRTAYRRAARGLRRARFQGFYERPGQPRARPRRFPKAPGRRRRPSWRRWPAPSPPRRRKPRWRVRAICSATPWCRCPRSREVPVAELAGRGRRDAAARRLRTRPTNIRSSRAPRNCAKSSPRSARYEEFCFDTETTGFRHLQRPHRRAVARRGAFQSVVRSFQRGEHARIRGDRAAAVRGRADRQDRPEHQVRPDGAAPAGDRRSGAANTTR